MSSPTCATDWVNSPRYFDEIAAYCREKLHKMQMTSVAKFSNNLAYHANEVGHITHDCIAFLMKSIFKANIFNAVYIR